MNFDRKMRLFIFLAIGITALLILFSSMFSYISLMSKTSRSLISNQIHTIAAGFENALQSYKNTAIALNMDASVQRYFKNDSSTNPSYYQFIPNARQALLNVLNAQPNINFIVIIKDDIHNAIYSGAPTLVESRFYERFSEDMENSRPAGSGAMRINLNSAYISEDPYAVSVYQPIYDTHRLNKVIGTLCFNVKEPMLRPIYEKRNATPTFDLYLIDGSGITVCGPSQEHIGLQEGFIPSDAGASGTVKQGANIIIYEKLGKWDYYIIGVIPQKELYKSGLHTVAWLVAAIVCMVILCLLIGAKIVNYSYRAMGEIVDSMDAVSNGRMDVSMSEAISGDDFIKIAQGFNHMMLKLNGLVEQVKLEQRQIEQVRLNALQSQINPHFLYNTLECIHWQAAMDGNKEVSKLVQALATYYRVCLSGGRDIIELSQELRHVESYLIIQNTRYGDIISCDILVKPEFGGILLPKMTLQPLIENSIYHGIKVKDGKTGRIVIDAAQNGDTVVITVEDNGTGMEQSGLDEINASIQAHDEGFGYGVRNVNKRIELTFGKAYGLHYILNRHGGITVEIRLPAKIIPEEGPNV